MTTLQGASAAAGPNGVSHLTLHYFAGESVRFERGDMVQRRDKEHPLVGQIVAIDLTGLAWIKYAVGLNTFAMLTDMERVP